MAKEEGTSFMSKINYGWQTFSLLTPIFMLLNILLQSAINKNIQGVVVFSVIIFAVIVNELLTTFKYLNGVIPEERSSTCGVLNLNRNYFMMNSTIILSFVLAFYGFNMFLYKNLNIIFLVVLSVFLFMDIVYYVLICSKGINIFKHIMASIIYGGAIGLGWSYFHSLIFKNNKDKSQQGGGDSTYNVYNNGQLVATGTS